MASILETAKTTLADATANVNVTPAFNDFPLVTYQEVAATSTMSSIPRFGHSNNFSQLFVVADDNDSMMNAQAAQAQQEDYLLGLLFVGFLILIVFTLWSFTLVGFKILGTPCFNFFMKPGFLSGRPFTIDDTEEQPTKETLDKWKLRTRRVRATFFICGIILTLFLALLVSKGFNQVETTRSIADVSLTNVRILTEEASILAEDLRDVGVSAIELRDQLVVELEMDRLCPLDQNYLAQDDITKAIEENAGAAIDMLDQLQEFATRDIQQMEDGLLKANNVIDDIDVIVETIPQYTQYGLLHVIPLSILTSIMLVGVVAAQNNSQHCCFEWMLSYVLLPVFITLIVLSYLACAALALSASANADFCSGAGSNNNINDNIQEIKTPDNTIQYALYNLGLDQTSTEFEIARYYISQCTESAQVDPFLFLRRHEAEITHAQDIVKELSSSLEKIDIETLSFNCGRDFEPLSSSLDTMTAILDRLDEAAIAGLNILSCDRIVPIYASVVYDGTCNYSVTGLTWMFSSLLIISSCGMIMIMFRSSYLGNVILAEIDSTDDDYNDTERAIERGQAQAGSAAPDDLYLQPEDYDTDDLASWKLQHQQPVYQVDTSDSGSVYTDGRGGATDVVRVYSISHSNSGSRGGGSVEIVDQNSGATTSPKLYELEENNYDSNGKIIPSAPYEHDLHQDHHATGYYDHDFGQEGRGASSSPPQSPPTYDDSEHLYTDDGVPHHHSPPNNNRYQDPPLSPEHTTPVPPENMYRGEPHYQSSVY